MKAIWKDAIIAESNNIIEIEGNSYFPADSVNKTFLQKTDTTTTCPWKGVASYYNIVVDGNVNKDAAWYYSSPKPTAIEQIGANFSGYVAFWKGVEVVN